MTEEIFRADAYRRSCQSVVTAIDERGITLDRTVFYPEGGGQPGDRGLLELPGGERVAIRDTRKDETTGTIIHLPVDAVPDGLVGRQLRVTIDWERRHRLMRMHTLLHLLCSLIPAPVTGGAIRDDGTGRLDFDLPESSLDKEHLTAELNRLVGEAHPVRPCWITEAELDARPELGRTMSVQPPRGQGRVRLLEIEGVDLQPCGGTHVGSTQEIGPVRVRKIEKKGRQNRRVNVELAE